MTKSFLIAGAGVAAMLCANPAMAQTGTTDDAPAIAEIVVTAQKREEKLQAVPLAVSVVSGAAIAASGAISPGWFIPASKTPT